MFDMVQEFQKLVAMGIGKGGFHRLLAPSLNSGAPVGRVL